MRDDTLKILKKILNLPQKERQELLQVLNTQPAFPATTSSRKKAINKQYTVGYFKKQLQQSAKFMHVVSQLNNQASKPQPLNME